MQAFTKGSGGTLSQYMNGAHKCMNLPPLRHSEKFSRGLTNQVSIFHSRKFDTKPLYWSFFLSIYLFPVTLLLLPRLTFQMNLLHSGHCARLCLWRNPLILYIQSITQPALNRFICSYFKVNVLHVFESSTITVNLLCVRRCAVLWQRTLEKKAHEVCTQKIWF